MMSSCHCRYLWEVVRAIMEGVRNPLDAREKVGSPKQRLAEEVGLQGLRLLQACTHRLASHVAVHGGAGAPKQAQAAAAATLQQQQQQQQRQQGEEGQQGRDAQGQLETQEQQQQQQHDEELQLDLHGSSHRGGEHASLADAANSPEAAQSLGGCHSGLGHTRFWEEPYALKRFEYACKIKIRKFRGPFWGGGSWVIGAL
eukprot:1158926-Pelagomonas_calceolata.AAC.14